MKSVWSNMFEGDMTQNSRLLTSFRQTGSQYHHRDVAGVISVPPKRKLFIWMEANIVPASAGARMCFI